MAFAVHAEYMNRPSTIIIDPEGTHFDPLVVKAFLAVELEFRKITSAFHESIVAALNRQDAANCPQQLLKSLQPTWLRRSGESRTSWILERDE
jgi:hypothetical protein